MYQLYYFTGACSLAVHALLEEAGAPFELRMVNLRNGNQFAPEYLKLNPVGRVPVLVDGDLVLPEVSAILVYLSEKHPDTGLLPAAATIERANCLRWLSFAASVLHPAFGRVFVPRRYTLAEGQDAAVRAAAERDIDTHFRTLSQALGDKPYILGAQPSIADFLLTAMLGWDNVLDQIKVANYPHLAAYQARLEGRPSFQRARAREAELARAA